MEKKGIKIKQTPNRKIEVDCVDGMGIEEE